MGIILVTNDTSKEVGMRYAYLNANSTSVGLGCRGGVGVKDEDAGRGSANGYELEIGQACNASTNMMAWMCVIDEAMEVLHTSVLGRMVLQQYHLRELELHKKLVESEKKNDQDV